MQVTNALERAFEIRAFYNELRIGHDGAPDCRSLVGPEPFKLSSQELELVIHQGHLLRMWLQITIDLCTRGYQDDRLHWLTELIEGDQSAEAIKIHRETHQSGCASVPLFGRPDMSAIGSSVEVQTPGSGWGYQTAIHNTVDESSRWSGPVRGFKEAVAAVTGRAGTPAAYVLYNQPFFREVEYFCRCCNEAGMDLRMFFQSLPSTDEVKFVRRPPLQDLLSYDGGAELAQACFAGKVVLEPGPSLLFDQKLAVIFPFHPLLREYYPDSVRELFPETHLVTKETPPVFDGQVVVWDGFSKLSRSKRQFILKYAGAKKGLRAGGKAVYNLSDCNQQEVQSLIDKALSDWDQRRSPWLMQKRVQQKYAITFLDHEEGRLQEGLYYPIFRPMYRFLPDQAPSIVAFTALFRKEWKVHGSSDAVMLPVEV